MERLWKDETVSGLSPESSNFLVRKRASIKISEVVAAQDGELCVGKIRKQYIVKLAEGPLTPLKFAMQFYKSGDIDSYLLATVDEPTLKNISKSFKSDSVR